MKISYDEEIFVVDWDRERDYFLSEGDAYEAYEKMGDSENRLEVLEEYSFSTTLRLLGETLKEVKEEIEHTYNAYDLDIPVIEISPEEIVKGWYREDQKRFGDLFSEYSGVGLDEFFKGISSSQDIFDLENPFEEDEGFEDLIDCLVEIYEGM